MLFGLVLSGATAPAIASSHTAARSSLSVNQWECSTGDNAAGCSAADLPPLPKPESGAAAVTAPCYNSGDDCVYVLGTGQTVQAYDTATSSWTSSDSGGACANSSALACMPTGLSGFAAAVDDCPQSSDTCIYAVGGTVQGSVSQIVEAYDTSTNTWTSSDQGGPCANSAILACMPTARTGLGAIAGTCPLGEDRCVYAIGGTDAGSNPLGVVEAYDPATNTWESSETGGSCANVSALACMPTPRVNFAATSGPCPGSDDWCIYAMGRV